MPLDRRRTFSADFVIAKIAEAKKKAGRKKGIPNKVLDTREKLKKFKADPIEELVWLANEMQTTNPVVAAKIWIRLLDSCESEERKKKASLPPINPLEEVEPEQDEEALLKELENGELGSKESSNSPRLETGETSIQVETSPEVDLPGDTQQ